MWNQHVLEGTQKNRMLPKGAASRGKSPQSLFPHVIKLYSASIRAYS